MKKLMTYLMGILLVVLSVLSSSASAADQQKDEDRLQNSGTVLKESLLVAAMGEARCPVAKAKILEDRGARQP
jgi:hypothetical protein